MASCSCRLWLCGRRYKHVNVLQHILGHFKDRLGAQEKAELLGVKADYHQGLTPLIVPLTLIKHYVQAFDVEYIRDQVYLNPHPKELMLRNHVHRRVDLAQVR
ncbi:MAG: YbgA family protein [Nitrospira sp.]|nr:YbgA family protein [Nitrospira sp.]